MICVARPEPPGWEVGLARVVATRSRPARREMRSARSASRVLVELRRWWRSGAHDGRGDGDGPGGRL